MRTVLARFAVSLLFACVALFGQIARDTSAGQYGNLGSSLTSTIPYTVGTSSNMGMVITIILQGRAGLNTPTSIVWNGTQSATQVAADATFVYKYAYYLAAPAAGAHNLVVTLNQVYLNMFIAIETFSGATQSVPSVFTIASGAGATGVFTTSLTTPVANCWTTLLMVDMNGGTLGASTGSSLVQQPSPGNGALFDSGGAIASAGMTSMAAGELIIGADTYYTIMVAIPPAAAPAKRFMLVIP